MHTKYNPAHAAATLEQLRKDGYRVFVSHRRPLKNDLLIQAEDGTLIQPDSNDLFSRHAVLNTGLTLNEAWQVTGGATSVHIYKDDSLLGHAVALCNHKDSFNKKRGLTIALGRALGAAGL